MSEICDRCGRPRGISLNDIDAYKKCRGGVACWERAYAREKARADALDTENQKLHEQWMKDVVDHCPHDIDDAVCCSECLAAALKALAAARRDIEGLRKALRNIEMTVRHHPEHFAGEAFSLARAALAAPAAGEEGKR